MQNDMDDHPANLHNRLNAIAAELSAYGLGIFRPHQHDQHGAITDLPERMISMEQNLKVSFLAHDAVPDNAVAVGWRWNGRELEVCAGCCGPGGPAND